MKLDGEDIIIHIILLLLLLQRSEDLPSPQGIFLLTSTLTLLKILLRLISSSLFSSLLFNTLLFWLHFSSLFFSSYLSITTSFSSLLFLSVHHYFLLFSSYLSITTFFSSLISPILIPFLYDAVVSPDYDSSQHPLSRWTSSSHIKRDFTYRVMSF